MAANEKDLGNYEIILNLGKKLLKYRRKKKKLNENYRIFLKKTKE
jgi:hypothetical protein